MIRRKVSRQLGLAIGLVGLCACSDRFPESESANILSIHVHNEALFDEYMLYYNMSNSRRKKGQSLRIRNDRYSADLENWESVRDAEDVRVTFIVRLRENGEEVFTLGDVILKRRNSFVGSPRYCHDTVHLSQIGKVVSNEQ